MAASRSLAQSTELSTASDTLTGISIGTAAGDRQVVYQGYVIGTVSALSWGGVTLVGSGTDLISAPVGSGAYVMLWATIPSGTTATLVATGATNIYCLGTIAVYGCKPGRYDLNGALSNATSLNTPVGVTIGSSIRAGPTPVTWNIGTEHTDYTWAAASASFSLMSYISGPVSSQSISATAAGTQATYAVSFEELNLARKSLIVGQSIIRASYW